MIIHGRMWSYVIIDDHVWSYIETEKKRGGCSTAGKVVCGHGRVKGVASIRKVIPIKKFQGKGVQPQERLWGGAGKGGCLLHKEGIPYDHTWSYMIINGYIWSYMIIGDRLRTFMIIDDHVWSYIKTEKKRGGCPTAGKVACGSFIA